MPPQTSTHLAALDGQLCDLEDYLREQTVLALAVGHTADARAFQHAMTLTIAAHNQAQQLLQSG